MVGDSNHIHAQAPRHLGESLDRPRHVTVVVAVVLRHPRGLLLHVRDGAHDAVGGRVASSGAGLARRHVWGVRGAGAGGGRGGARGGALAALRGGGASRGLAAAPLTFPEALRLFCHVLHDLLRHLHRLEANHVHFQEAVHVLLVSVKADSKQDILFPCAFWCLQGFYEHSRAIVSVAAIKPEAGMARRPFQLVFLAEMKCQGVTPREDLITDMALIFRQPSNLKDRHKFEFSWDHQRRMIQTCDAVGAGGQLMLTDLVRSLEVVAHRWEGLTGVITALHCAAIHGAFIVNLRVLLQIRLVLKPTKEVGWL